MKPQKWPIRPDYSNLKPFFRRLLGNREGRAGPNVGIQFPEGKAKVPVYPVSRDRYASHLKS
jgi:hypothetical protein